VHKTLMFVVVLALSAAGQGVRGLVSRSSINSFADPGVLRQIGATEQQMQEIDRIQQDQGRIVNEQSGEVVGREAELNNLLAQPQTDWGQVERAMQAVIDARIQVERTQLMTLVKMRQVLRPEQMERFVKRSAVAGNEASAIATLRTLNTAGITYASTYNVGFSDTLTRLGSPSEGKQPTASSADLVDEVLSGQANGTPTTFTKNGYRFTYTPGVGGFGQIASYTITAQPVEYGVSGLRSFFTDQSAVLRGTEENRPATERDNPI
jgi:type IV pilus assembly protein PilA